MWLLTPMYGPAVRCKRFVKLVVSGLASMYPVSSWSCFAPGHHGYQRACVLVTGQASIGPFGSLVCTENSNPEVMMVKPAQDGVRTYETGSLNPPRIRGIFV